MRTRHSQGAALLLLVIVLLGLMLIVSLTRYRVQWYQAKQVKQHIMASQHRWQARAGIRCVYALASQHQAAVRSQCQRLTSAVLTIEKHESRWRIHSQAGQQQIWSTLVWVAGEPRRLAGSYYEQ